MELRHLRFFIAAAEEGSLTLAAKKRLHTAQPSLSRQIRDLEYEVGVELISRSVRGIELTAAGTSTHWIPWPKIVLATHRKHHWAPPGCLFLCIKMPKHRKACFTSGLHFPCGRLTFSVQEYPQAICGQP
jgi:hypothetical protein